MNESEIYLENYDVISDNIKYISNSLIRLKVLAALYEGPLNMKDLTNGTNLSYSSVSSIIHGLEVKDLVYRESNKYYLSTSLKLEVANLLEFNVIVNLLNNFFNILDGHIVDMIPNESVFELYLLGQANLLESDSLDVYKIYNFIEDALTNAECVRCILPFYYPDFIEKLDELIGNDKYVEIIVPKKVLKNYKDNSEVKYLSSYEGDHNFLLIASDKIMILGLFKEDGYFDQNRLLTSKNEDSIKWANNLFKNFKNK